MTSTLDTSSQTPPMWAEPDSHPDCLPRTDGTLVFVWERRISTAVWICRADRMVGGLVVPGATRVHVQADGIHPGAARCVAAELAAAELYWRRTLASPPEFSHQRTGRILRQIPGI
jgi:hypothetical protein